MKEVSRTNRAMKRRFFFMISWLILHVHAGGRILMTCWLGGGGKEEDNDTEENNAIFLNI